MARLIPVSNDFNGQLPRRGLGNPNSLCNANDIAITADR